MMTAMGDDGFQSFVQDLAKETDAAPPAMSCMFSQCLLHRHSGVVAFHLQVFKH